MRPSHAKISGKLFVVIKRYVSSHFRPGVLQTLARGLSPEARGALVDAQDDAWYSESALLELMPVASKALADSDLNRFYALAYDATLFGMRYGFREAMNLGGAAQALDHLPSLWQRLHRGEHEISVRRSVVGTRITIQRCMSCDDLLYRHAMLAMLRAFLYAASGAHYSVSVLKQGTDWLEICVAGVSC